MGLNDFYFSFFELRCGALRTKINTPPWVFSTFFKLYKWYQIAQSTSMLFSAMISLLYFVFFVRFLCLQDLNKTMSMIQVWVKNQCNNFRNNTNRRKKYKSRLRFKKIGIKFHSICEYVRQLR